MTTMKMKKLIGSALLGATVLGGVASVGAGVASADPGHGGVQTDHARPGQQKPVHRTNGQNPTWRPGKVYHQGAWRTPIWDAGKHHWGFWIGPVWVPIG